MDKPVLDADRIEAWRGDLAPELARALDRAEYGPDLLTRAEGIAPRRFDAIRLPLVLEFLRGVRSPAAAATRLFAYADAIDSADLDTWLPPPVRHLFVEQGWLVETDSGVTSRVRILPYDGLWLASDELVGGHPDPVMPPGATTQELTRAFPASLPSTVLDVGCGCGALALGAARRGATALGLDIDPRAIAWSRFNAHLNGIEARFEQSDLFDALSEERFDLVIAQPPFVPQPPTGDPTTYLHGGARGDELTFRMLTGIAPRIADGGRGIVLFDVPDDEEPLWKRVRKAIDDENLDIVVIAAEGHTADLASVAYASATHPTLTGDYANEAIRYRRHLRRVGIERFWHTMLVLSRRGQDGPTASVTLTPQTLSAYDYEGLISLEESMILASTPRETLCKAVVAAAPGSVLVQKDPLDQTDAVGLEVEFRHGRGQNSALSDAAAVLLQLARQPQTVGALIRSFADAADAEVADVQSSVLSFVRDGLIRGLLVEA